MGKRVLKVPIYWLWPWEAKNHTGIGGREHGSGGAVGEGDPFGDGAVVDIHIGPGDSAISCLLYADLAGDG